MLLDRQLGLKNIQFNYGYFMSVDQIPLLDCRSFGEFCRGHVKQACSLPATELAERMHELPKRTIPVGISGNRQDLKRARDFLIDKGYTIAYELEWSQEFFQELRAAGVLLNNAVSKRLWEPAALLKRFVKTMMPLQAIKPGFGLDIACGSGRDMVYLAMHGWTMMGMDYSAQALKRAQQLAACNRVSIQTHECDLEATADPFLPLARQQFDLIVVARYLHRPLLPILRRLLAPGGILIYQTFMQGAEQLGSPRNPNYLLKPQELATLFADMQILMDKVEILEDGRPVSAFIARRPPLNS